MHIKSKSLINKFVYTNVFIPIDDLTPKGDVLPLSSIADCGLSGITEGTYPETSID
jgi:hypothetical protein